MELLNYSAMAGQGGNAIAPGNPDYDYSIWTDDVKTHGGAVVHWPFSTGIYAQHYGKPAAQFTTEKYVAATKVGDIAASVDSPTQTNPSSTYVYVLAPASALANAPKTMTLAERFQNAFFATGDKVADAAGLPSLSEIETFLHRAGWVLVIALVCGLLIYAAKAKHAAGSLLGGK